MRILQSWPVGCVIFNFPRKSYDLTKNCFGLATRVSVLGIQRVSVLDIRVFNFWAYNACYIFGHTTRVSILGIQRV